MKLTKSKLQQIIKEELGREVQSITFDSEREWRPINDLSRNLVSKILRSKRWSLLPDLEKLVEEAKNVIENGYISVATKSVLGAELKPKVKEELTGRWLNSLSMFRAMPDRIMSMEPKFYTSAKERQSLSEDEVNQLAQQREGLLNKVKQAALLIDKVLEAEQEKLK